MVQGRAGEFARLFSRRFGRHGEEAFYNANDWLMETMKRNCRRKTVTALHSYEDCSLRQFEEAKRLGKACLYEMPIGYYPWWEDRQKALAREFADWIPAGGLPSSRFVRPGQKLKEMELADLVLAACSFVERTIREFHPNKKIALVPYGVDAEFWSPGGEDDRTTGRRDNGTIGGLRSEDALLATSDSPRITSPLRFIYAGQSSIRKGIPVLLAAWSRAELHDAELILVGSWQLAESRLQQLPKGVRFAGPVGLSSLRNYYRQSDVFVFPSFFEGFGLVILEAMACGLPVVASDRSAAPDLVDDSCGRIVAAGNIDELTEVLRWCAAHRETVAAMKDRARQIALAHSWANYRESLSAAVAPYV